MLKSSCLFYCFFRTDRSVNVLDDGWMALSLERGGTSRDAVSLHHVARSRHPDDRCACGLLEDRQEFPQEPETGLSPAGSLQVRLG